MSDSPQGSGWLQGPNGKWYPPPPATPAAVVPPPPSGPAHEAPAYERIGSEPYQPPAYAPGIAHSAGTSGFAIASLVLGIMSFFGLGSVLAIIFGNIARRDIRRDPTIGGRGMATAGVVLGWLGVVGVALLLLSAA